MFWDSVVAGLKVLTYWQTYVAGLEYLAIFFIPMIVIGMIMEKNERIGGAVGCLSMFFLPVLQVAAMAVFVLTLAPVIFGFSGEAAGSFPWKVITLAPGAFFKLVGVLVVAAIVLAFIPILGRLQSLHTLVLGGIALMFVLGLLDSINPGVVKGRIDFVPGFWFSVGLLVIGGVMSWIGMMVAALIVTAIDMAQEGLGQLIMFPIGAIFGFIPVFMYGAWLGAQVRGGF
ncbi:MAG: hypothetical protein HYY65_07160 [Candidatus Tectomicrobia bacterium]|uniref:Uncharacterized protein n=1 Tax=Tectimicrobiota bacterium TaxID=2528274 RepID=A0A932GPQ0_UNCTE|nr:hypothetical protein [Candidatus Tectomicrobia bacterium]